MFFTNKKEADKNVVEKKIDDVYMEEKVSEVNDGDVEILLENEGDDFNFKFTNCLIRFNNSNLEGTGNYVFSDATRYEGIIRNVDPDFEDPFENLMRIGEDSGANGLADSTFSTFADILGTSRSADADSGAYESVIFEE